MSMAIAAMVAWVFGVSVGSRGAVTALVLAACFAAVATGVSITRQFDFVRARRPTTRPVRAGVEALPFADSAYDVAVGLTILYTVPDDARAVAELARVLRPGGALLLVEPAFASLGRAHDATVHGRRRYRRAGLTALVVAAGLTVARATYAYSFLAPPAAALGALDRARHRRDVPAGSDVDKRALDRVFAPLADGERRWLAGHDLPLGTSLVLLATR